MLGRKFISALSYSIIVVFSCFAWIFSRDLYAQKMQDRPSPIITKCINNIETEKLIYITESLINKDEKFKLNSVNQKLGIIITAYNFKYQFHPFEHPSNVRIIFKIDIKRDGKRNESEFFFEFYMNPIEAKKLRAFRKKWQLLDLDDKNVGDITFEIQSNFIEKLKKLLDEIET